MKVEEVKRFLMLLGLSECSNRRITENKFFYDKFARTITIGTRSSGWVNLYFRADESFWYIDLTRPK